MSPWRNARHLAVGRVGEQHAEGHPGRPHPVELRQRELRLRARGARRQGGRRDVRPAAAYPIRHPRLRQEQPERQRHRHLAARERHRHQHLAVGDRGELPSVLAHHAHGVPPLFEERGVVDDQHCLRPAHQPLGLAREYALHWRRVPVRAGDEVVQLGVVRGRDARRHRLDTLPVAGAEQPPHIHRRPLPPAPVA